MAQGPSPRCLLAPGGPGTAARAAPSPGHSRARDRTEPGEEPSPGQNRAHPARHGPRPLPAVPRVSARPRCSCLQNPAGPPPARVHSPRVLRCSGTWSWVSAAEGKLKPAGGRAGSPGPCPPSLQPRGTGGKLPGQWGRCLRDFSWSPSPKASRSSWLQRGEMLKDSAVRVGTYREILHFPTRFLCWKDSFCNLSNFRLFPGKGNEY